MQSSAADLKNCHDINENLMGETLLGDKSTKDYRILSQSWSKCPQLDYRVFSHDATAAILVSQNNKTTATLVPQTSPLGVELFSYANAFLCPDKFAQMLAT